MTRVSRTPRPRSRPSAPGQVTRTPGARRRDGRVSRELLVVWSLVIGVPNDNGGVVLVGVVRHHRLEHRRATERAPSTSGVTGGGRLLVLVVYWLLQRPGRRDRHAGALHDADPPSTTGSDGGVTTRPSGCSPRWCGDPCLKTMPTLAGRRPLHHRLRLPLPGRADRRRRCSGSATGSSGCCGCAASSPCTWSPWCCSWTYPMAPPWMASRDGYPGGGGPPGEQPRLVRDRPAAAADDGAVQGSGQQVRRDAVPARGTRVPAGLLRHRAAAHLVAVAGTCSTR